MYAHAYIHIINIQTHSLTHTDTHTHTHTHIHNLPYSVGVQSLKVLKTPEFLPYIIFIASPSVEALKVMSEEGRRFARGNRVCRVFVVASDKENTKQVVN